MVKMKLHYIQEKIQKHCCALSTP